MGDRNKSPYGSMFPSAAFQRRMADEAHEIQRRKREQEAARQAADPLPSTSKRQHFTPRQDREYLRYRARPSKGDRKA